MVPGLNLNQMLDMSCCIGSYCEVQVKGCDSSPCLHGAFCMDTDPAHYNCSCLPGYSGLNCEVNYFISATTPYFKIMQLSRGCVSCFSFILGFLSLIQN
jgi:hypothetical protein